MKPIAAIETTLKETFGYLFEEALIKEIIANGTWKKVPHDEILIGLGDVMHAMPLILSGAVKILRDDNDGHELLLYFLEAGDTCAMSFSCCMARKKSKIRAITEGEVELIMVPAEKMNEWMGAYRSWRTYVFDSIRIRMDEFIEAVDSLAFMQMDERLLKYLRDRVKVSGETILKLTHQEVAYDLNTSRVVVSRLLKRLELEGMIKMGRSHLEVLKF